MKKYANLTMVALLIMVFSFACAEKQPVQPPEPVEKIKIERADQLPRHIYKLKGTATELFNDKDQFRDFVTSLEADLILDLEKYDISDKTTVKNYYGLLSAINVLAMNYSDAEKYLNLTKELEDKPAAKLTSGLITKALIKAKAAPEGQYKAEFRKAIVESLKSLPYDTVQTRLKKTKGRMEIISENLYLGILQENIDPAAKQGELSKDLASSLISFKLVINELLPLKEIIVEEYSKVIAANAKEKENIWPARNIELAKIEGVELKPVLLAVWDSGVDISIFKDQLYTNAKEIPANDKDDDNNGFVDDVNGIGFDLKSNKVTGNLYKFNGDEQEILKNKVYMKGFTDVSANIDSPEASEVKKTMSNLPKDQVKPFLEGLSQYGNYAHGTHVSGIALAGNPAARLMFARMTYDYKMIPDKPTVEQAVKDGWATAEAIAYFKNNGVRVVNMSWGGSLKSVEIALEQHNEGANAEERKALARKIYDITRNALYNAIRTAPEILFITSAGNSNNDVKFDEFYPSSFELDNIMSVGAVDQAGDETGFTSFGKADVYANGFEVDSFVPGGDRMKLSGTSMSSPNVANLAGKLLAVNPDLKPMELKTLIIDGCDDKKIMGDKVIKLMNPKKSLEILLTTMKK